MLYSQLIFLERESFKYLTKESSYVSFCVYFTNSFGSNCCLLFNPIEDVQYIFFSSSSSIIVQYKPFFPSFTCTIHNLYCSCNTNGWLLLYHECSAIVLLLQFSFIDISWCGTNFRNLQKIYKPHGFFLDPGDKLQINVSDFKITKYTIYRQLSCMAILQIFEVLPVSWSKRYSLASILNLLYCCVFHEFPPLFSLEKLLWSPSNKIKTNHNTGSSISI